MLVPKMAATSKSIAKADAYAHLVKKKGRHMTKEEGIKCKTKVQLEPKSGTKKMDYKRQEKT